MARATVLGGVSLQVEVVMRSNESKVVWYGSSRVAKKNKHLAQSRLVYKQLLRIKSYLHTLSFIIAVNILRLKCMQCIQEL